jgi:Tfp pilus assembly protein PilX
MRTMLWRVRQTESRDGGFAMVVALLALLVVGAMSVGVAGIVTNQVQPTQVQTKTTATLDDAESGLQIALNQIRNAVVSAYGQVNSSALPCGPANVSPPTTGVVGASAAPSSGADAYSVTITYFTTIQAPAMLAVADNPTQVAALQGHISCSALTAQSLPPAYAYITSSGQQAGMPGLAASQGNRTLHLVYQFSRANAVVIGGEITSITPNLCWQTTGISGASVTLASCALSGGVVASSSAYTNQQFQAAPAGNGNVLFVFGGNLARDLCLDSDGATTLSLTTCNAGDQSQQFTSSGTTLTDYNGNCVSGAATLVVAACAVAVDKTFTVAASVGVAAATATTVSAGGVAACAVPTAADASGCVIATSIASAGDLASAPQLGTLAVSIYGLTMCTYSAATGTFTPFFGVAFGSSCVGASRSTATAAPSASVSAPAASYASAPASIQAPGVLFEGENAGG